MVERIDQGDVAAPGWLRERLVGAMVALDVRRARPASIGPGLSNTASVAAYDQPHRRDAVVGHIELEPGDAVVRLRFAAFGLVCRSMRSLASPEPWKAPIRRRPRWLFGSAAMPS